MHTPLPTRTNVVRRVSHARPVVVLEEHAANDAAFTAQLRAIDSSTSAQLARLPGPACYLPPAPRRVLDKKLARSVLRRARTPDLHFWTLINHAESLLRSAISGHVRDRGR